MLNKERCTFIEKSPGARCLTYVNTHVVHRRGYDRVAQCLLFISICDSLPLREISGH